MSKAAAVAGLVTIMCGHIIAYSQEHLTPWMIQRSTGDTLYNCLLDSVSTTTLLFHQDSTARCIALDSIAFVSNRGKTHPITALLIGGALGGALGYVLTPGPSGVNGRVDFAGLTLSGGSTIPAPSPLWYTIGGACVGALIGLGADHAFSWPKSLDLREMDQRMKANKLWLLINGRSPTIESR